MAPPSHPPSARLWQPDATLLDGLTIAAVALDLDGVVVYANPAALDLFGSPFDELVGGDARSRLFDEPERGVVDEVLALVLSSGSWTGELDMLAGGTTMTRLGTTWTIIRRDDDPAGTLVLIEGHGQSSLSAVSGGTDELVSQPLGRRLRRLAAVTSELLAVETVESVAEVVTEHMMDAAGGILASLSLMVDESTMALIRIRGGNAGASSRWATFPLASNVPVAESARTGQPLYIDHEEYARRYPDLESLGAGPRSLLCLPLVVAGGRCLGVVALGFPGRRVFNEAESVFFRLLADTCALTIDRIGAQAAAADREAKLAFLAEASARLSSELDYEATLKAVAEAAVPWFADWCGVSLAEDGILRSIAVAHQHPEHVELVRELQERYPTDPNSDQGGYDVLRTGVSTLYPEIPDELLAQSAQDEEHLRLMRQLELRSGMSCALKVGDRIFGVITWVAGEGGRRFTEDDVAFGENLAQRAAVAIDNAHLHSQLRDVALQLQRAVLPDRLPDMPGWTTAVQYLPAGRTDAGGDFYDVIALDDGRVAMFVGDVMGRGVHAASVMAQMRSAIRTLIAVDPAPAAVLAGMDRVFEALHLEQLVTMVYAIADPEVNLLEVISGGHPPLLLLAADGQVEIVTHSDTLILGVGGGARTVRSLEFGPGDKLLLYTDGLIERRGEDADSAMARLVAAVREPVGRDCDAWLAAVVEELRDPTRDDDVAALLVARHSETG